MTAGAHPFYGVNGKKGTVKDFHDICEKWISTSSVGVPLIEDLCQMLGVSEQCWSKYSKEPEFAGICARVRLIVKSYMIREGIRPGSNWGFLKFCLSAMFDMREKTDVTSDGEKIGNLAVELVPAGKPVAMGESKT